VRQYYLQFEEQQTQSLIDQRIKEHLGQAAAFQQAGVAFNPMMAQRPSMPILPPPRLPIPGSVPGFGGQQLFPGMRPMMMPRPGPIAPGRYCLYHSSALFIEASVSLILHADIVWFTANYLIGFHFLGNINFQLCYLVVWLFSILKNLLFY